MILKGIDHIVEIPKTIYGPRKASLEMWNPHFVSTLNPSKQKYITCLLIMPSKQNEAQLGLVVVSPVITKLATGVQLTCQRCDSVAIVNIYRWICVEFRPTKLLQPDGNGFLLESNQGLKAFYFKLLSVRVLNTKSFGLNEIY